MLTRPFGKVIHDLAQNYNGSLAVSEFRKLEKLATKSRKAELDVQFLKNCHSDAVYIRKRLLHVRTSILRRTQEKKKLDRDLEKQWSKIGKVLNSIGLFILKKVTQHSVDHKVNEFVKGHEKKLKGLTKNSSVPFTHKDTVLNISSYNLSEEELDILKFGLTFAIKPPHLRKSQVFTTFELLHQDLKRHLVDKNKANEVRSEIQHLATTYVNSFKPSLKDLKKLKIPKRLKKNKDIIILRPDKGNGVVVLDKLAYNNAISDLLSDDTKFKKLQSDPTLRREGQLQRYLRKLKKNSVFDCGTYRNIYPTGSQPATCRLYGLPKLHKVKDPRSTIPPFRPIVSSIGTYNYNLAKYLCSLLKPHIFSEFCATDTFSFVKDIQDADFRDVFMVSYDVASLFTNIPLSETFDLAVNAIFESNTGLDLKLSKTELKELFHFATSHTHFLFNGCFYDQVDGVAMGSPLAPVLANFFMGHYEKLWLNNYTGPKVLYYRRYVDDIICCFRNSNDARLFFEYLNSCHPNIKFTMETEKRGQLPFLDVLLSKQSASDRQGSFITSVYLKRHTLVSSLIILALPPSNTN